MTFFGRTNPYHGVQTILYKRCYDTFFYVEKLMTDSLVCDTETNSDYLDNTVDIVQKTLTSRDLTGHVHIDSQLLSKFFSSFQVMLFELLFQEKGEQGYWTWPRDTSWICLSGGSKSGHMAEKILKKSKTTSIQNLLSIWIKWNLRRKPLSTNKLCPSLKYYSKIWLDSFQGIKLLLSAYKILQSLK